MVRKLENFLEWGGVKKDIALLVISGLALAASLLELAPSLPWDLAWVAIILCGVPIIMEAIIGLVTAFDIKADVLVSLALIASVAIHEDFAAGEVAFIMQLGALLEDLTVARAQAGIAKLVKLKPQTARVIKENTEAVIPADQVAVGDRLRVLPGETIPVDGVILSGQTAINQAVMTGESLPVDKGVGDGVSSGTVNQFGAFVMEATKVGEDSSMQRLIKLVQSADAGKAKIVRLADKWATWIVVTALTAAVLTWFVTGQPIRAVTILVVFCPCSLVLATPTAIMAAIGNATHHGFLVREGDALERLAHVKKIAFDKTGTLTVGVPEVTCVQAVSASYTDAEIYAYAAAVEKNSEHPLGKAIVRCYGKAMGQAVPEVSEFAMIPGKGVEAKLNEKKIQAGNAEYLASLGVQIDAATIKAADQHLAQGATVTYLAIDGKLAGMIALADALRPDSQLMVSRLQKLGITPVLLTGDNQEAAQQIAAAAGISEVHASCLPEDKLQIIDACQKAKENVCMLGDGVNDAPALKKALVGIAMGGIGSDIAVDAADIALINDELKELPHLFALSRHMLKKIKFNLSFSMLLNFVAIILAMTGVLNPVLGALVHNAGSVFVIINSAFLLTYKASVTAAQPAENALPVTNNASAGLKQAKALS